jgi:hypothetical protein
VLDDGFAERDLSIARHDNFVVAANAENSCGADEAGSGALGGVIRGGSY